MHGEVRRYAALRSRVDYVPDECPSLVLLVGFRRMNFLVRELELVMKPCAFLINRLCSFRDKRYKLYNFLINTLCV